MERQGGGNSKVSGDGLSGGNYRGSEGGEAYGLGWDVEVRGELDEVQSQYGTEGKEPVTRAMSTRSSATTAISPRQNPRCFFHIREPH